MISISARQSAPGQGERTKKSLSCGCVFYPEHFLVISEFNN
ncbi:hypothetical protein C4K38_3768 [Pseudomonas chlororaphis subsp. piscium]|nr:hypothetical protein C4K38_3768 [Pseudomonas chlororaphis subsp. piscium]